MSEAGAACACITASCAEDDELEYTSVEHAGPGWVKWGHALLERNASAVHVMQIDDGRLEGRSDNIWQRANLSMIEESNRLAPERAVLALWDGKLGDGPGGTEHFL